MNTSYDKSTAVVVLPPVTGGRLQDSRLRAWLAQADLSMQQAPQEILSRLLAELGLPYPEEGLAALRMWGQTSDRPTHWIAAADPVHLEAHLDHLRLHALRRRGVEGSQLRTIVDYLQARLAPESPFGFARLGSYSYVSSTTPIPTASLPAYVVDGEKPNDFIPGGEGAARYRNLQSEIEMALHDHDVNRFRETQGQPPVNSLWIWGGGVAPQQETRPQPPLFSDDALLTGYWYSATAVAEPWRSIDDCIEQSVAGFVAETPEFEDGVELLEESLTALRKALRCKRLSRLILLFRDGLRADLQRSHAVRIWRRDSALLQ